MRTSALAVALALLLAATAWATGKRSKAKSKPMDAKDAKAMTDALTGAPQHPPFFPDAWKACQADADCIEMPVWCRDTSDAIDVKHHDEAKAMVKKACPRPGGMLFLPQKVSCRAGRCELGGPLGAGDGGR